MGWCAPPAWATLRRAVPEGELLPSNPVVAHHMRAADGLTKLERGLAPRFPGEHAPDDWHLLTQVVQARSQATGVDQELLDESFERVLPYLPWVIGLGLLVYLLSGAVYTVEPNEQAVLFRFGRIRERQICDVVPL
jgi:hypothetical protein